MTLSHHKPQQLQLDRFSKLSKKDREFFFNWLVLYKKWIINQEYFVRPNEFLSSAMENLAEKKCRNKAAEIFEWGFMILAKFIICCKGKPALVFNFQV